MSVQFKFAPPVALLCFVSRYVTFWFGKDAVKALGFNDSFCLHHPYSDISLVGDRIPEPRPKLKNRMADGFHGERSGGQKETDESAANGGFWDRLGKTNGHCAYK